MDDVPSIGPEFFDIRYAAKRIPWDYTSEKQRRRFISAKSKSIGLNDHPVYGDW